MFVKWLLLCVLAWLLSCCSVLESVPEGGCNVRKNALSVMAWTAKKSDFWTTTIMSRKAQIEKKLSDLITAGYTLVNGPTSGFIDLTAQTSSSHKYVVIWRSVPSGVVTIDIAKTMTDTGGNIITNGGDVVVLGILLNSFNQVIDSYLDLILFQGSYSQDFQKKLTFSYLSIIKNSSSAREFININFINDTYINSAGFDTLTDPYMEWCQILNTGSGDITIGIDGSDVTLKNVLVDYQGSTGGFVLSGNEDPRTLYLDNVRVQNCISGSSKIGFSIYSGPSPTSVMYMELNNVFFKNSKLETNSKWTANVGKNLVFINGLTINFGTILNLVFYDINDNQYELGNCDVLDIDAIETTNNYSLLEAVFWDSRASIRKRLATITRNGFETDFQENVEIGLEHKNTGDEYYRNIQELEMIDDLINHPSGPLVIKNLSFYDNTGTTLIDYRNDLSFLIIARDSSGNPAVFGYHDERLYPTVYTDVWNGVDYEVEFCFSMKRMPENTKLRNVNFDDNSPISGSLDCQDMTSAVIIR